MTWHQWLAQQAVRRDDAGLRRTLLPRGRGDGLVDLAGNDYLGLSRDPVVTAAAALAAQQWGAGAGASRLVTGTLDLHVELEHALATYTGQPAALVTGSGYAANLAVVTALADRESLVVSDAHIHASLVDAARLSRAEVAVVPHSDVEAVRRALEGADGRRTLVLAESIYSVLGDEGPLVELADVCAEHGALLVVDEAHGLGVHGPGVVHRLGLNGLPHVVVTLTLSKALGSQGGAVLGPPELIDHLVNTARPFIFDTALAPGGRGRGPGRARCPARPTVAPRPGPGPGRGPGRPPRRRGARGSGRVAADALTAGRRRRPGGGPRAGRAGRLLPAALGARRRVPAADHGQRRRTRRRLGPRRDRPGRGGQGPHAEN